MKGLPRSISRGTTIRDEVVKLTIPVNDAVTVTSVSTAAGFGGANIAGLPEGNILLLGIVANLAFTGSGSDANLTDTWSGDFAIGTAPVADADLGDATDTDILASQAIGAATAEAIAKARYAEAASVILDNTAGTGEMNLNMLIDAANIADDESVIITATGEVYISYIVLGDD